LKELLKGSRTQKAGSLVLRGLIGTVGFLLSPLSWWNDLVVNFPLAYGFAWIVGRALSTFMLIHKWLFLNLFIAGYFITNLGGFLMIHYSIFGLKKSRKFSLKKQIGVSVIYSVAIVAFFGLEICKPDAGCQVFPSWVRP
jgi:hypothetical protein